MSGSESKSYHILNEWITAITATAMATIFIFRIGGGDYNTPTIKMLGIRWIDVHPEILALIVILSREIWWGMITVYFKNLKQKNEEEPIGLYVLKNPMLFIGDTIYVVGVLLLLYISMLLLASS